MALARGIMKRIGLKIAGLTLMMVVAQFAHAAEMDIFADAPVKKPRARVAAAPPVKPAEKSSSAVVASGNLVGPSPAPTQWVQAMEASLSPLSTQSDPTAIGTSSPLAWLGWALATIFGSLFLNQVVSSRRKQLYLRRAGDRDSFWLPPSNRRRF